MKVLKSRVGVFGVEKEEVDLIDWPWVRTG